MNIDALNINSKDAEQVIESYEQYFSEMEALTGEQIDERVDFAEKFESIILYVLALIAVMAENDQIDRDYAVSVLNTRYKDLTSAYAQNDDYINGYIDRISKDIVDTTIENKDSGYYTSTERAKYIAANEANTVMNRKDLQAAIDAGYTKKTWLTMRDRRVRHSHSRLDGETIDILEPFTVGNSLMLVPKDSETYRASAEEIVNCRCSVKYSR